MSYEASRRSVITWLMYKGLNFDVANKIAMIAQKASAHRRMRVLKDTIEAAIVIKLLVEEFTDNNTLSRYEQVHMGTIIMWVAKQIG